MLNLNNKEFYTIIKCINDTEKDISLMLILQKLIYYSFTLITILMIT